MDTVLELEQRTRKCLRESASAAELPLETVIKQVIRDFETENAYSAHPEILDKDAIVAEIASRIDGYGPLQQFFDDDSIEEIWLNSPGHIYVARSGVPELTSVVLSAGQLKVLIERMLASSGRRLDLSTPFVDAVLPDGSRLHVVIPPVARQHWAVNIRKFIARAHSLNDLVNYGSITAQAARFLDAAVQVGLNIIVSGSTGAGKTTFLNCLSAAMSARDRLVTIEEVFELQPRVRDVVAMQCRQANLEGSGEISMRRLVKEALRMRPNRIVVGEVREAESLDMLIAMNSGLPAMASIHANSARDAVGKLCTLPLLAGENVSASFVTPTVANCIDLIVHCDLLASGKRRVREIVALSGRVENQVIEVSSLFKTVGEELVRANGMPPHRERFERAGLNLAQLLGG